MFPRFSFLILSIVFVTCLGCGQEKTADYASEERQSGHYITIPKGETKVFYSWSADRIPMVSAHRGGPYPGYPENAIATFDYVLTHTPAVIECDIEMTSDSVLVMMHDNTLDRTTNGSGRVRDMTWDELRNLNLKDNQGTLTDYKIPSLEEVLNWSVGKALLTLDVKRGVPFEMVIDWVRKTQSQDYAAIITYNANDAQKVYELAPELMISVGIGNMEAYQIHHDLGIPDENMIAFTGVSEPEISIYEFLHKKGIYAILGVLGNLDRKAIAKGDSIYASFIHRGADILATDRPIEAAKILESLKPQESIKSKYLRP